MNKEYIFQLTLVLKITISININEKLTQNNIRTAASSKQQNKIIPYIFVSSNLFTQLNTLTELTNNCDSFFHYLSVQAQEIFDEFTVKKVTVSKTDDLFNDISA